MRKQVTQYVRECTICQQNNASHQHLAGVIQLLHMPKDWEEISMDFFESLPRLGGFDMIWSWWIGRPNMLITTTSMVTLFVCEVVKLPGCPLSKFIDYDKLFISLFWRELFWLLGTTLFQSTTYYLQTDRQTKILN